jgi:CheY-like chemotaxis protein
MRILVLDDDLDRHDLFRKVLSRHKALLVQTVAACIEALKETKYDLVYLDHDLADFCAENKIPGMYGSQELTGVDVARFMANDLPIEQRPKEVVVHSWNPDGAKRIVDTLKDAGFNVRYQKFEPKVLRIEYA